MPSTSVASMPYFGVSVSTTQRQEPNSARAATIWSPAFTLAQERRRDRRHAGRRGARVFRAFQRAHALFEHVDGRVGVARIDEARLLALEARFGGFGACRRHSPASGRSLRRSRRSCERSVPACTSCVCGLPVALACVVMTLPSKTKKPAAKVATGPYGLRPNGPLATCLTWLQADRPNHHGITVL